MRVLTGVNVRHVRQSGCPGTFADVVVDVDLHHARADRPVRLQLPAPPASVVVVPPELPEELLQAFVRGLEQAAAADPRLHDLEVVVTLRRVAWHPVDSTSTAFRTAGTIVVERAAAAWDGA